MPDEFLAPELEAHFPNLRRGEYRKTSKKCFRYNCIAHAAERNDTWWWPCIGTGIYWPEGVPLEETVDCFVHAYATQGYEVCEHLNVEVEAGFQKLAIYVDDDGAPTHAARQLPSGEWTSKLGREEDIVHQKLEAVGDASSGSVGYGRVHVILKRPV